MLTGIIINRAIMVMKTNSLFSPLLIVFTILQYSGEAASRGDFRLGPAESQQQRVLSPYDPHLPASEGPWFEGWYTRITDSDGSRSLAVLAASNIIAGSAMHNIRMSMPGYLLVLISDGGEESPTRSFEVFPEETYLKGAEGVPVQENPNLISPADFEWMGMGFGWVTENSFDIVIPNQVEVHATMGDERDSWNELFKEASPFGVLALLPLPLYWHVHSLGSPAEYEYTIFGKGGNDDIYVQSDGHAHMEKNWGTTFPLAWSWGQGITDVNQNQFVYAGGRARLLDLFVLELWVMGYRSDRLRWSFGPLAHVITDIDACNGILKLTMKNWWHTITLESSAPLETFGNVSIPTEEGFVSDSGIESFSATTIIRTFWHIPLLGNLFGWENYIEEKTFRNSALEFGAGYQCSD